MTWAIEYKCRRCGEIDRTTRGAERTCFDAVITATVKGQAFGAGIPVHMVSSHHCSDGGFGVTDLIGAAPEKK